MKLSLLAIEMLDDVVSADFITFTVKRLTDIADEMSLKIPYDVSADTLSRCI